MKVVKLTERDIRNIVKKVIREEEGQESEKSETKQRCLTTNTMSLDEIVGDSDSFRQYSSSINKRNGGVTGIIDTLDLLKTIRLNKNIADGGEHLSYDLLNHLNKFRPKNYYDETSDICQPAIEKIIELYKENEHGNELVKDIEKVLALQSRNDEITPSPRTKEYLKRCLMLIKGK
jgi:hypothetical protein